jgi:hypothetical protein
MENSFMKARGVQFWTLLALSCVVSLLMLKQISLSHAIIEEQHVLVDAHEKADTDTIYQSAWEKLAMNIWKAGAQDPAMQDLLKTEGVAVHAGPPPGTTLPATSAAPPAPSAKPLLIPPPGAP